MKNSYRIIDACVNRTSEGIRVLEDHFRFSNENKEMNRQLRDLRHSVRDSLKHIDALLISNRESSADQGLGISQNSGSDRKSGQEQFVTANFKRVQEAVRSIEENLHLTGNDREAKVFENIRFKAYTLEKKALCILQKKLPEGIYCITAEEYSNGRSNIEVVKEMLTAGIKIIQYREKEERKSRKQMLSECREIRELTRKAGALFIVNDFFDIAILSDADGIHCGQDDLPVSEVRRIAPHLMVGVSTHSPEQACKAVDDGADYIGVGPIFATSTKKNVCDPVGIEYLEFAVENIEIPFVAIGGIKEDNISRVIKKGAETVCLVTEITGADDIGEMIEKLRRKFQ